MADPIIVPTAALGVVSGPFVASDQAVITRAGVAQRSNLDLLLGNLQVGISTTGVLVASDVHLVSGLVSLNADGSVGVGSTVQFTGTTAQRPMIQYPLSYVNSPISMVECSDSLFFMLSPNDTVMFSTSPTEVRLNDWNANPVLVSNASNFGINTLGSGSNILSTGVGFFQMNDFSNQQFLVVLPSDTTLYAGGQSFIEANSSSKTLNLNTPSGSTVLQADGNTNIAVLSYQLNIGSLAQIQLDGSALFAAGNVTIETTGIVTNSINNSWAINPDGSASFGTGAMTIDTDGSTAIQGVASFPGGVRTVEGDVFYAHTVAGNLVWTTSP